MMSISWYKKPVQYLVDMDGVRETEFTTLLADF